MRILLIHNEYRELGGEDKVVEAETKLLEQSGIEVVQLRFRSSDIQGIVGKIKTAWELPNSNNSKNLVLKSIIENRPQLLHVHNFFPLATPAVFSVAKNAGIPTVFTLHNYRILCANGLLLRNGQSCELCVDHGPSSAIKYSCYQGSKIGSIAIARMIRTHQMLHTWHDDVDRFIVLTNFAKAIYMRAGLASERFIVKSNFLFDPQIRNERSILPATKLPRVLFVGRLSKEKGLLTLLEAKKQNHDYELHIVGDGALRNDVVKAQKENPSIFWHGFQETANVYRYIQNCDLLVFPSECYENFPIILLEAMALSKPVLASKIGGIPEIVKNHVMGRFFTAGNPRDLANALFDCLSDRTRLKTWGEASRKQYLSSYTPEKNIQALINVYESVLKKEQTA